MKKLIVITVNLFLTSLLLVIQAQEKTLKRYEVESGMVEYTLSTTGKMMGSTTEGKGTAKLCFKNWGAVELQEEQSETVTVSKLFGKESKKVEQNHTMNKLDNGTSYSVDFEEQKIYTQQDMAMESIKMFNNGNANQTGKEMLKAMGGEKIGEGKVLGYTCEIWKALGTKIWFYKGVPLKEEASIMGVTTTKIATKADFNISVPKQCFALPNYPIVPMNGYMDSEETQQSENIPQEDSKYNLQEMQKMSYEEYKKMVLENDPEAKNMSEQELKQSYELLQLMNTNTK